MRTIVVGAGVSGAHAALTLLERGQEVDLWDIGREEAPIPEPEATFDELKARLPDPVAYFLGSDLSALIPPAVPELFRYPPSREFLAGNDDPLWSFIDDGFHAYGSFARGGLANGWGANALSFDEHDVADWPLSFSELEAAYRTVYARIPVAGPRDDDLSPYLRATFPSQSPVQLSAADQRLMQTYSRKRHVLAHLGVRIGPARLAVVTDAERADACGYCNRCVWGCPRGSIYNPGMSTLVTCEGYRGFRYVSGRMVIALRSRDGRIDGVRYLDIATQAMRDEPCDSVFLAAGALQSGAIFLRTLKEAQPGIAAESDGLMDTTVAKIPFVAPGEMGREPAARGFQFNRLIAAIVDANSPWPRYLHMELLHLTSLIYHPLIERLPFGSRLSSRVFFALKSALGVATLFFPDRITAGNRQVLADEGGRWAKVRLCYRESDDKLRHIEHSLARARAALRRLRRIPRAPVRSPAGAGIHYAGTVPMGAGPKRCDGNGRSNLFRNLYIADGAAFPSLPSKSITMSLAAHATRVARNAAR